MEKLDNFIYIRFQKFYIPILFKILRWLRISNQISNILIFWHWNFPKTLFFFKFKILKKFFLDLGNTYHRDFFLTGSLNFELYNEKKIKSKFWSEPYKPGSVSKILPRKNDLFSKKNFSNFWNYFFKKNFFFIKFTCLRI